MKKGKLYKANKYNKTLFALGVDRENYNIFDGKGDSKLGTSNVVSNSNSGYSVTETVTNPNVPSGSLKGISSDAANIPITPLIPNVTAPDLSGKKASDFTGGNNNSSSGGSSGGSGGAGWGQYAAIGANVLDGINVGDNYKRGLWDAADPMYHLAEDNHSTGGDITSDIGVNVTKAGLQMGNGYVALAGGIIKVAGDLWNAGWGHSENAETTATVNNENAKRDNVSDLLAQANTNEDILNYASMANGVTSISSDGFGNGWFTNKGTEAYNNLLNSQQASVDRYNNALMTAARNVDKSNDENIMKNFAAYGGPVDMPSMGGAALDYGFMSDYINAKNRANSVKDKMSNNPFGAVNNPTFFALGGVTQNNGSDWGTGLTYINAGGSHEDNPYDGVQVGISKENGKPNLVEEGETIFDDYVYSKRIMIDNETKRKFHVGKKAEISYADLSKKLEKEASERPNDAISQRGLEKQMHDLADEQERQKGEMQGVSEGEPLSTTPAGNGEMIAMEPTADAVGTVAEGGIPVGEGGMGAEAMEGMPMREMPVESVNISAEGGNLYPDGGSMKERIYKALGFYLPSQFEKWAKENNVGEVDWENALKNQQLIDALKKSNPALGHSIELGNDFGVYQPNMAADKATIQSVATGNWKFTNGKGWKGSEDLAFKQATKGLSDADIEALTTEQLAERMKNTTAYKNTSKWLENKDNALLYLNTLINDKDTPQVAKDYALKFVKDGKWKDGFNYDYATVFGKDGKGVRETNPGTYWHSVVEANRGKKNNNYFIHDDGSVEAITGDVPTDLISAGSYSWKDAENDNVANYYKKAAVAKPAADAVVTDSGAKESGVNFDWKPNLRSTWGRTAGLMGPMVGLGMMAAGVGKPDYSLIDAAVNSGSRPLALAAYKSLGNYMKYEPFDIWSQVNRNNANARATDRALLNNSGTLGTKMAGLIANNLNNQTADAELNKKAQEYNNALNLQVQTFNRGTDEFNAKAYNQNSATNAGIINAANQQRSGLMMQAAQQKMAADAGWYNSWYKNWAEAFKGLNNWGKENEQYNMISAMAADGLFGNLGDSNVGKLYGQYVRKKKGLV